MSFIVQTTLELGMMYALVSMALFLSYRVLDIADLTTDGAFVLGMAVSVTSAAAGHPVLGIFAAMLAGRLVWGLASLALYGVVGNAFTFPMFLAGAFVNAVPGIILHLVLIPAIMFGLERSGVLRKERQE